MVKSKKMSKTSIAVIVLAIMLVLSLVLGLTGAWYQGGTSAPSSASTMTMGTWGNVTITATGAKWQEHDNGASTLTDVDSSERGYVMPGDKVLSDTITVTYTATGTDNATVYYLMKIESKYYTVVSDNWAEVTGDTKNAGTITSGSPVHVDGTIATITVNGTTYSLDGELTGETSSWAIPNHTDSLGQNVSFSGQTFGQDGAAVTYQVAIIQVPNLSPSQAYALLKTALDA